MPDSNTPLRQTKEDIILMANEFLNRYSQIYDKDIHSISNEALKPLLTIHGGQCKKLKI